MSKFRPRGLHLTPCLGAGLMLLLACFSPQVWPALAQSAPQAEPSQLREVYQDWTVTCHHDQPKQGDPVHNCQMSQELRSSQSGQLVMGIFLPAKPTADGSNALIVAPFGLALSKGMALTLLEPIENATQSGDSKPRYKAVEPSLKAEFRTCLPQGCLVSLNLDMAMKQAFRLGTRALVTMSSVDQHKPVSFTISLSGFTAAEQRLKALAVRFE